MQFPSRFLGVPLMAAAHTVLQVHNLFFYCRQFKSNLHILRVHKVYTKCVCTLSLYKYCAAVDFYFLFKFLKKKKWMREKFDVSVSEILEPYPRKRYCFTGLAAKIVWGLYEGSLSRIRKKNRAQVTLLTDLRVYLLRKAFIDHY